MAKSAFTYEIVKKLAMISDNHPGTFGKSQTLELNVVSMNGKPAKVDIRGWSHDDPQYQMGKGVTLSLEEATNLCTALADFLESEDVKLVNDSAINAKAEEAKAKTKTATKADLVAELEAQRALNAKQMEMMMQMAAKMGIDTSEGIAPESSAEAEVATA